MEMFHKRIGFVLLIGILAVYCFGFDPIVASVPEIADDMSFNFIAYGDTRGPGTPVSDLHDDIIDEYLTFDPELILHTGDLAYHGSEWYQLLAFNESMTAVWESGIPFYIAPGNHEMYTDDWVNDPTFTNYTLYVDYEDVAAACGGTELYYSFDYNGIHFVIINTEHYWDGDNFDLSSEQWTWLESDLGGVDNETFVVFSFHRPPFSVRAGSSGLQPNPIQEELLGFLMQEDVDLVFNGHDHMYYRTEREGIYFVVAGGGGAPLHAYNDSSAVWQEGDVAASEYSYCNVEVNSTHVVVSAYLLDGSLLDSFFIERSVSSTSSSTTSSISSTSTTTPPMSTPSESTAITTTTSETSSVPTGYTGLILALVIGGAMLFVIVTLVFRRRS